MASGIDQIRAAQASQDKPGAMLRIVGETAAELLAANADAMDAAIEAALRRAGEHLGADRALMFQISPDGSRLLDKQQVRSAAEAATASR